MPEKSYDYIVVGAGTAGSVIANRLSAIRGNTVLLLEAGPMDHRFDFRLHMPAALTYPLNSKRYNWGYKSEPEPHMNNRRIYHPRGKVLGGSSSINGMIHIRGNPLDFDKWAQNPGLERWSYKHCLPYFKKFEQRLVGSDAYRGADGPLKLTTPACDNPLFEAFFASVQQAGYPLTSDVNGAQQEGFGKFDQTIYKGRRYSAARAFLHPVWDRENLTILCNSHTKKVILAGKIAVGVEVKQAGKDRKFYANKEVILAGGAFNSPQLLQLSGIGNSKELKEVGINPVLDLPGVGENLQDHLELYVQWACKKPVSLFPELNPIRAPWIGFKWLFMRKGTGASNHFEAGGFIKGNNEVEYPNLQFHFLPLAIRYDGSAPNAGHGFQLHVGPMNTDVRGSVKVTSNNPFASPRIIFNYLSTKQERKEWVEAIQCARKLINQPAFDELRGEELSPGAGAVSDEEILAFVAAQGESAYHPSCTCKMGYDDMAVVDADLKVHGITGLRVVDASVMPSITNGNINAPVMMIAEKAADIISGPSLLN